VTEKTVFRLASISKTITAVAIMQLLEKGQIDLNAPVQKYVPEFPEKSWPVTTRQLLGHLSSIRHYKGNEIDSTRFYPNLKTAQGQILNSGLADTSYKIPGGGFCTTTADLAHFAIALMENRLLKPETMRLMWTPLKTRDGKSTNYGLGSERGQRQTDGQP